LDIPSAKGASASHSRSVGRFTRAPSDLFGLDDAQRDGLVRHELDLAAEPYVGPVAEDAEHVELVVLGLAERVHAFDVLAAAGAAARRSTGERNLRLGVIVADVDPRRTGRYLYLLAGRQKPHFRHRGRNVTH